jgi:hypothetical protein
MRSDMGKDLNHRVLASGVSSRRSCDIEADPFMVGDYHLPSHPSIAENFRGDSTVFAVAVEALSMVPVK